VMRVSNKNLESSIEHWSTYDSYMCVMWASVCLYDASYSNHICIHVYHLGIINLFLILIINNNNNNF
jgi:hypothetical protein